MQSLKVCPHSATGFGGSGSDDARVRVWNESVSYFQTSASAKHINLNQCIHSKVSTLTLGFILNAPFSFDRGYTCLKKLTDIYDRERKMKNSEM